MAKKTKRMISWSDEFDKTLERIAEHHADKMRLLDISPYTSNRPTGERGVNISGVIEFLILKEDERLKAEENAS